MKLTFDELNLLVKTLSEKENMLETKKNIMQKQEQEKCEDDWSFHPSTELKNTKDAYYALSRLVEKIKNNIPFASAISFIVFVMIYLPCLAASMVFMREAGNWKYLWYLFIFTTSTAWIISFITYNITKLLIN